MATLSMCGVRFLGRLSTTSEVKRIRSSVFLNQSHLTHDICMCTCTNIIFPYQVSPRSDQTVGGSRGGRAQAMWPSWSLCSVYPLHRVNEPGPNIPTHWLTSWEGTLDKQYFTTVSLQLMLWEATLFSEVWAVAVPPHFPVSALSWGDIPVKCTYWEIVISLLWGQIEHTI